MTLTTESATDQDLDSIEQTSFASNLTSRRVYILVGSVYLLASLALFHNIWLHGLASSEPSMFTGDFGIGVINMGWIPFAALHLKNPLHSAYEFAPYGLNTMATPGMFVQSLVMAPITLLFGPVVSDNLAIILTPVISAFSAFVVYFKITKYPLGAFVAASAVGFSPAILNDATFSLFQVGWEFAPPLIFYIYYKVITASKRSPYGYGIWLGVLLTLQFYASLEVFATVLFWGCALGAIALVINYPTVKYKLKDLMVVTSVAVVLTSIATGYAAYFFAYGPGHALSNNGSIHNSEFAMSISDLLFARNSSFNSINIFSIHFTYIAVPILLVAMVILRVRQIWTSKLARYCLVFAGILMVSTLGTEITLLPDVSVVPNPIHLFLNTLPIISQAIFGRFIYFALFLIGIPVITVLQNAPRFGKSRFSKIPIKGIIVAFLIANIVLLTLSTYTSRQAIPAGGNLNSGKQIPKNAIVYEYPAGDIANGPPLIYLSQSGFRYRITSGYGTNDLAHKITDTAPADPLTNFLYIFHLNQLPPSESTMQKIYRYITTSHIGCIIVSRAINHKSAVKAITYLYGRPKAITNNAQWCSLGSIKG